MLLSAIAGAFALQAAGLQAAPAANENAVAPPPMSWCDGRGVTGDWWGRDALEEHGITFSGSYTFEGAKTLRGGVQRDASWLGLVDLAGSFDLERLFGIEGATISFDAYSLRNANPSTSVGDAQGVSNLAADRHVDQIGELWYEQVLGDGALRVKLGKIDAYGEFQYARAASEFLNLGVDFGLTLIGLPSSPDPAGGVVAFWYPAERMHVAAGVFDGAGQTGVHTGSTPIDTFLGDPSDSYGLVEVSQGWSLGYAALAGRAKIGAWHHTGAFDRFDGGTDDGTSGFYATLEQELARENPEIADDAQAQSAFVHIGLADRDVSAVDLHTSAGFVWSGAISGRDADVLGIAVSRVGFSDRAGIAESSETTGELFYRCQLTPWISFKPDLQFVKDPSGDAALDDAWVALIRVEVVL